jgi:hypothetical protein
MNASLTRTAISATLHCLTGCAAGEILGMVLTTALGWSNAANIVVSVILSFVIGYTLAIRPVRKAGLDFESALRVALLSDTVSITVMELVDNLGLVAVPGAMNAKLTDVLFWVSLVGTLAIAFVITVPVNRWMIARGKGHAVAHEFHHHAGQHAG